MEDNIIAAPVEMLASTNIDADADGDVTITADHNEIEQESEGGASAAAKGSGTSSIEAGSDVVESQNSDPAFLENVRGKLMTISPMNLVSEAVHEFKALFKTYSSIGSGTLTYGEFAELLVRSFPVDARLTREELQSLIQKLDSGFSGSSESK